MGPLNNTDSFIFPVLNDFTVIDKLWKGLVGGNILRATFKDSNCKEAEDLLEVYLY